MPVFVLLLLIIWFFFVTVKEKAEVLLQVDQLTQVKDELTEQVRIKVTIITKQTFTARVRFHHKISGLRPAHRQGY